MKKTFKIVSVLLALTMVFALFGIISACKHDPEVVAISLNTQAAKKDYLVGDTFSADGVIVTAKYDNDETETVPLSDCTVFSPDMNTKGNKLVKITYAEQSASYTITVAERHSCSQKCPVCGKCLDAECLEEVCRDKCGVDGEEYAFEAENPNVSLIASDIAAPRPVEGDGITYIGYFDIGAAIGYSIEAEEATVAQLKITVSQRGNFKVTDKLFIAVNGELLNRGTQISGEAGAWTTFVEVNLGCVNLVKGQNLITFVSAYGLNFDKITLVSPVALDWYTDCEFSINTDNVKTTFNLGETFSYEGLAATLTVGGEPVAVSLDDLDLEVKVPDTSVAGKKTVTVVYKNFYVASYEVNVEVNMDDKTVNEFSAIDNRVELKDGAGGKITIVGGHLDNINNNFGAAFTYKVYSPENCTADMWVKIGKRALAGLKFNDTYEITINGTSYTTDTVVPTADPGKDWNDFALVNLGEIQLKSGLNTITFTVKTDSNGKGINFEQLVLATEEVELDWYYDLKIDTVNVKTSFEFGENFNCDNLVVKYSEGANETTLTAEQYTISEPDMLLSGTKNVTVSYNGFTATYQITVAEDTATKQKYSFSAYDGNVLVGGGLTVNTTDGYINRINDVEAGTVEFNVYSPANCIASLSVAMNKMQKGSVFTDLVTITVNDNDLSFDTVIDFEGNNASWAPNWIELAIGGLRLKQGNNVITFTTHCKGTGFWFRGINLESSSALEWTYSDFSIDTTNATLSFVEESTFNPGNLVVKVDIGGVETTLSADEYEISTPDLAVAGTKTVTVTYRQFTATYEITVTGAPAVTYELNAYDGHATLGGMLTANTSTGYIDKINDATDATSYIEYEINASAAKGAKLTVVINTMQNGNKFTDRLAVTVNGNAFASDAVISYTQASGWQAVWVEVELGTIQLKQGKNTIRFAKACAGEGFWFRGIKLDTSVTVKWYNDVEINTENVKTTFAKGEAFNYNGLVVSCTVNGVTTDVSDTCTVTTPNMLTAGTKSVIVKYGAYTTSYTVTVTDRTLSTNKATLPANVTDGSVTLGGGLKLDGNGRYVDGINGAQEGLITYKINASEACVANLEIVMNRMQKDNVFTDLVAIKVNGVAYNFAETITFDGANQNWVWSDDATWINTVLGSVSLNQGENTIEFVTKCYLKGFWFRGIALESTATITAVPTNA